MPGALNFCKEKTLTHVTKQLTIVNFFIKLVVVSKFLKIKKIQLALIK